MTLLEQAKKLGKAPSKRINITGDHIELAVAWAKGEINMTAISKIMGFKYNSQTYVFLATALREYVIKK